MALIHIGFFSRAGTLEGSKEWFDRVTEQYNITIDAIRAVQ